MNNEDKFKKAMEIAKQLEEKDKEEHISEAHILTRSSARYDFIYHLVMEGIL